MALEGHWGLMWHVVRPPVKLHRWLVVWMLVRVLLKHRWPTTTTASASDTFLATTMSRRLSSLGLATCSLELFHAFLPRFSLIDLARHRLGREGFHQCQTVFVLSSDVRLHKFLRAKQLIRRQQTSKVGVFCLCVFLAERRHCVRLELGQLGFVGCSLFADPSSGRFR
jgi:hypothetical protein